MDSDDATELNNQESENTSNMNNHIERNNSENTGNNTTEDLTQDQLDKLKTRKKILSLIDSDKYENLESNDRYILNDSVTFRDLRFREDQIKQNKNIDSSNSKLSSVYMISKMAEHYVQLNNKKGELSSIQDYLDMELSKLLENNEFKQIPFVNSFNMTVNFGRQYFDIFYTKRNAFVETIKERLTYYLSKVKYINECDFSKNSLKYIIQNNNIAQRIYLDIYSEDLLTDYNCVVALNAITSEIKQIITTDSTLNALIKCVKSSSQENDDISSNFTKLVKQVKQKRSKKQRRLYKKKIIEICKKYLSSDDSSMSDEDMPILQEAYNHNRISSVSLGSNTLLSNRTTNHNTDTSITIANGTSTSTATSTTTAATTATATTATTTTSNNHFYIHPSYPSNGSVNPYRRVYNNTYITNQNFSDDSDVEDDKNDKDFSISLESDCSD